MAFFDKTTIQFIQKLHFSRNILKFFLGCIPSFDAKIAAMKNKDNETPYNPGWDFSTSVPFKTLITQHQNRLTLIHMKKMIWYPVKR